jgi:hypothetical protein
MTPVPLTDKTRSLGKPKDWQDQDGECGALDIYDNETPNGNFMISAWKPDADEMETLNAGGFVFLHIRGYSHPVVAITVAE